MERRSVGGRAVLGRKAEQVPQQGRVLGAGMDIRVGIFADRALVRRAPIVGRAGAFRAGRVLSDEYPLTMPS